MSPGSGGGGGGGHDGGGEGCAVLGVVVDGCHGGIGGASALIAVLMVILQEKVMITFVIET